jgi:predicted Zn-dependent peptidase
VQSGVERIEILALPHGATPLVGLRLSVRITEGEAEAGAGWIIARLAQRRVAEAARRLGAEASIRRTTHGVTYTVAGPRTDFDYLAYLLRLATSVPERHLVEDARRELSDALDGLLETGPGQVELELRERTARTPPTSGTAASIPALEAGRVLGVWARTHRPSRMRLLVSGDVSTPLLLASLSDVGAPEEGLASVEAPPPVPAGPRPDLDLIRRFTGRAWSGLEPDDPALPVIARLATEALRDAPGEFEARVTVWDVGSGPVLAALGVAFPARFGDLDRALDRLLDEVDRRAGTDAFLRARAEVERGWTAELTTPLGRIEAVGRDLDRTGRPTATRERLDAVAALDPAGLRAALDRLRGAPPATVTVR